MAVKIIIDINDQGNLKVLTEQQVPPIMMIGFLEFAKNSVVDALLNPKPQPTIQPASAIDLSNLSNPKNGRPGHN